MIYITGILISLAIISIPIIGIISNHKRKIQNGKIREMELQKELLELEVKKQDGKIKLLEEENKKLDKIIYEK